MKTWLAYLLVSGLSGSPLLGILAVAAIWVSGTGFWLGRLPDPRAPFRRWSRIRSLRMDLGMNPRNVNAATELGGLLADRNPTEAQEILGALVDRCPDLPLPMMHLGRAQLAAGQTEVGRATIDRALAMKPDLGFGEPLVILGDHYLAKGDGAEARAAYTRATKVHSSFAQAWYKLGRAAKMTGDAAGAKEAWEMTLSSTRHAPPFKAKIDRFWRLRAWLSLRFG